MTIEEASNKYFYEITRHRIEKILVLKGIATDKAKQIHKVRNSLEGLEKKLTMSEPGKK